MNFSKKALSIVASPTLAIDAKAKQMKAQGLDVIGFGVGEPDFDTPQYIKDAAKDAIDNGFTKYTVSSGMLELKKAICEKLKQENDVFYEPNEIIVSNGAKHSLTNIFAAILNPGDEVIVPTPYWVSYPEMIKLNDGIPVLLKTKKENGFKATKEELQEVITSKTKAIIINTPSNPTGQIYSKEELLMIAKIAVENNIFVISDEIYEKLIYDHEKHISIASLGEEIKRLTIIVNGVSKSYAMTGWRIGYTACEPQLAQLMSNIQSHATSNPNSIAQKATIAAITGNQQCIEEMKAKFNERRNYMYGKVKEIKYMDPIYPQGAFYIFIDIKKLLGKKYNGCIIQKSSEFAEKLLEVEKVAVVPGDGFGLGGYIRLSYATSLENIIEGLNRIEKFVSSLSDE